MPWFPARSAPIVSCCPARELEVRERQVGSKTIEIIPDGSGRVRQQPVDPQRAGAACLDAAAARRLGLLALEAERSLGGPQDLEWAIRHQRVFLLQSRRITTLERPAGPSQTIWSNMNSREVLPDVLTPMSWSVASFQLECLFASLLRLLGIDRAASGGRSRQPIFGLIQGRAYANLNTIARIVSAVPGLDRLDVAEGLGGEHGELLADLIRREPAGGRRQRLRRAVRWLRFGVWCVVHAVDRRSDRVLADFRRRVDKLAGAGLAAMSEKDLLDYLASMLNLLERAGPDLAAGVAVAMGFVRFFFNFAKRRPGPDGGSPANRMLGGLSGLSSAEAGLELWRLAAWTRRQAPLRAIVAATADFELLRRRLIGTAEGRSSSHAGTSSSSAMATMRSASWTSTIPAGPNTRTSCWACCAATLAAWPLPTRRSSSGAWPGSGWPWRRTSGASSEIPCNARSLISSSARRRSALGCERTRETKLSACWRPCDVYSWNWAGGWRRRGVLEAQDDIFFVNLAELRPLVAGAALGGKIAARKAEFARQRKVMPPPIVLGQFDPEQLAREDARGASRVLHGLAASAGVATGPARVMLRPQEGRPIQPGEILVAPCTDPGWTPYFLAAAGIVMDVGGLLSHGSIVAREYGIPAVVNVGSATRSIATGQIVRVDGDRGVVTVL